jgi:hypothetical protein
MHSYLHKIFILVKSGCYTHSLLPSSTGGGSAALPLAHVLDLFDSNSSASDAEPTDPVPPWKRPQISPIPMTVSKHSEALAPKGTLEQFLFWRLS